MKATVKRLLLKLLGEVKGQVITVQKVGSSYTGSIYCTKKGGSVTIRLNGLYFNNGVSFGTTIAKIPVGARPYSTSINVLYGSTKQFWVKADGDLIIADVTAGTTVYGSLTYTQMG